MRHPVAVAAIVPSPHDRVLGQTLDWAMRWTHTVAVVRDDDITNDIWSSEVALLKVSGSRFTAIWWGWVWRKLVHEFALTDSDYIVPLTGSEVVYDYQAFSAYVRETKGKVLFGTRYQMIDFEGGYSNSWPRQPQERPLLIPVRTRATFTDPWYPRYAFNPEVKLQSDVRTQEYGLALTVNSRALPSLTRKPFEGEALLNDPADARDRSVRG